MNNVTFRVIFDRSAFHGDRFETIRKSALRDLHRRGIIKVYHTPIFLDETVSSYGASKNAEEWRDHLLYSLDVCSGIFLDRPEIFHNELVSGRGQFARFLEPERPSRRYDSRPRWIQKLRNIAASGDLSKEWAESTAMRLETQEKKNNQRDVSKNLREVVAKAHREKAVIRSRKPYSFSEFKSTEFERTGRQLMDQVDKGRSGALADQWAQRPDRYPFYSAFVESFLYNGFYAMTEHNKKLDRNSQPDYQLLAYLTWADLVVSDDTGFFRNAFETIWKPRGKRLETAETFATLMDRLQ